VKAVAVEVMKVAVVLLDMCISPLYSRIFKIDAFVADGVIEGHLITSFRWIVCKVEE
jgi:hypothetical protein